MAQPGFKLYLGPLGSMLFPTPSGGLEVFSAMSNPDPETSGARSGWHQVMTECRQSWQAGADGAALPLVSQFPSQHRLLEQPWAGTSRMPGRPFPQPLKKGAGSQTIQWKPGTTASWHWLICLRTLHSCRSHGILPFLKHFP